MDTLLAAPILFVLVPLCLGCAAFAAFGFCYIHVERLVRRVRGVLVGRAVSRRVAASHPTTAIPVGLTPMVSIQAPTPRPAVATERPRFSPSRPVVGSGPLPALP